MKPFLKHPDHELAWPAFWLTLLGVVITAIAIKAGSSETLLSFGLVSLLLGLGVWQQIRTMVLAAIVFTSLMAILQLARAGMDFNIRALVYGLSYASIAWGCYSGLRGIDAEEDWNDQDGANPRGPATGGLADDLDSGDDPEDDKPLISIVLLCREARYLESAVLARIASDAWGIRLTSGDGQDDDSQDEAEGFVVGESPMFVIKANHHMMLVHNFDQPYWDDPEGVADSVNELRLGHAIGEHRAWLSVDVVGDVQDEAQKEAAYVMIGKLIHDLADEGTLAAVCPGSEAMNVWSDELAERLLQPGGVASLGQSDNAPVVPISGDDPRMVEAVAQAQRTLPEFIERFKNRTDGQETFVAKIKLTVGETSEFIWIDILGFEPRFVHGTLGNDPVNLGDLKINDQVEAPIEDICDWGYSEDGELKGMFTAHAIAAIQAEADHE